MSPADSKERVPGISLGERSVYADGMGVATGIAFDEDENLYVGDRSGTVFKIDRKRRSSFLRRSSRAWPPIIWPSARADIFT